VHPDSIYVLTVTMLLTTLEKLERENAELRQRIERLSINPNFNTYTRVAGFERATQLDRRHAPSGQLALVAIDIAGMGALNKKIGELAVNRRIRVLLSRLRGVALHHQLNSGDEFVLYCDSADAAGLCNRIYWIARALGFSGAYCAWLPLVSLEEAELIETANRAMETVYKQKGNK
jgi:GGDEF domain-containing protein